MVIYVLDNILNSAPIETDVMLKCARLLGLVRQVPVFQFKLRWRHDAESLTS
jgi:hypothetical protein